MPGIDKAKLERYRKGELKFMQIFNLNATQMASVMVCAHNFFREGRLEEAKKIFEGLEVMEPNHPYIHTMLGAIFQRMESYDRAITHYNHALKLHPQDIYALTNRAEIHLKLGKFTEAATDLKKAIELDGGKKNSAARRARLLSIIATESLQQIKQQKKAL